MNIKHTNAGKDGGKGRPNLVAQVSGILRDAILNGRFPIGKKLPSEAALTTQYEVSRTVVREAIAALRADGLVEARQGAGVFVTATQISTASPLQDIDPERISSIVEVLELRAAVEVEAANLAALRRSPQQDEAIMESCRHMETQIANGEPTTDADFGFHLAIADATNNPRFRQFLELIGRTAIPRARLQEPGREHAPESYLQQIMTEHRRIAESISDRDHLGAQEAMRVHLQGSQQRYREMLRRN